MRELNECTAEVFRRGEQRIKDRRRKRNRALAVCIPICLIAAVSSAISLPSMTPEMESDSLSQAAGEAAGIAPESAACPYTAVKIQAAGMVEEVTDPMAATEMFEVVKSLFADAERNDQTVSESNPSGGNFPEEEDNTNHDQSESANNRKGCTITFTAEDGLQAVYRLNGNTLVNVTTGETVFLSDTQAAGLKAVLDISA